jgi:hypothetical protein
VYVNEALSSSCHASVGGSARAGRARNVSAQLCVVVVKAHSIKEERECSSEVLVMC